jgi:hypothetical protein
MSSGVALSIVQPSEAELAPARPTRDRRMVRTELSGQHSHLTEGGVEVHIWTRDGSYLARGRYEGKQFGETLGTDPTNAAHRLRHLLVEIDNGTFVRSSDRPKRQLRRGAPPKLDMRGLCDAFLTEKRAVLGKDTTSDYETRLRPVIEFAEGAEVRKRWPLAADVNRDFVLALRKFLAQRLVARNGRSASPQRPMAPVQVFNVLDCTRTMFNWAAMPAVNMLPAAAPNPFTSDLVGDRPAKNPLRPPVFPLERRLALVGHMDVWQLLHLSWRLVLPLRPEDFSGLLVTEVDLNDKWLRFGSRFGDADFNKGKQSFVCPVPAELLGLLRHCIDGRVAGPLLRRREVFEGRRGAKLPVSSVDDESRHIATALRDAGDELQTPQDAKRIIRQTLLKMGGVSEDSQAKELKELFVQAGLGDQLRPYDMRGSVNTDMERAGVSLLVQKYVTGHAITDIQFDYVSIDPAGQMRKFFDTQKSLLDAIMARAAELGFKC